MSSHIVPPPVFILIPCPSPLISFSPLPILFEAVQLLRTCLSPWPCLVSPRGWLFVFIFADLYNFTAHHLLMSPSLLQHSAHTLHPRSLRLDIFTQSLQPLPVSHGIDGLDPDRRAGTSSSVSSSFLYHLYTLHKAMTPKDAIDLPPCDTATYFSGDESGSGWEQRVSALGRRRQHRNVGLQTQMSGVMDEAGQGPSIRCKSANLSTIPCTQASDID